MKYIDNYSNDLQSKVARNILFVTLYIIYCLLYNCIKRVGVITYPSKKCYRQYISELNKEYPKIKQRKSL